MPGGEIDAFADTMREIAARMADLDPDRDDRGRRDRHQVRASRAGRFHDPSGERRAPLPRLPHTFAEPLTQIAGTFCRSGPELVDRRVVACALDRLTFTAGSAEPKLAELFAQAETRRNFCGHNGPILASTPKPPSWLDSPRQPALRGRLAAR